MNEHNNMCFKFNVHLMYVILFVDAVFCSLCPVNSGKSPWILISEGGWHLPIYSY